MTDTLLTAEQRQAMRAAASTNVPQASQVVSWKAMLLRALDDIDARERQVTHGEHERQTVADAATAHADEARAEGPATYPQLRRAMSKVIAERDEARAESARRLALLKQCEKAEFRMDWPTCPICDKDIDKRHKPDCALAAELARAQEDRVVASSGQTREWVCKTCGQAVTSDALDMSANGFCSMSCRDTWVSFLAKL